MKTNKEINKPVNKEIETKRNYLNEYINLMDQKDIAFLYELFHIYINTIQKTVLLNCLILRRQ